MSKRKIAIVYDWMDSWGGVERILLTLNKMYPEADWYTSYIDPKKAEWTQNITRSFTFTQANSYKNKITTSFIQSTPSFIKKSRILSLVFYPFAFESFDFREYDKVISVTSSFAKGIITHPNTKHICILLTPTRWLWGMTNMYLQSQNSNVKTQDYISKLQVFISKHLINSLREWDYVAAQRPDKIIAISKIVSDRCKKYYKRESEVIYPPFDIGHWKSMKRKTYNAKRLFFNEYYLIVSRLEPYKKVDLAVETFNKMQDKKLIIVGKGTQKSKLNAIASKNIRFIQDITDQELADLYSNATALIMPQEEDFGYVALEAQFFGCPVIAYDRGGSKETVITGKTGLLFAKQTSKSLGNAVAEFEHKKYNLEDIKAHLNKFLKKVFVNKVYEFVSK